MSIALERKVRDAISGGPYVDVRGRAAAEPAVQFGVTRITPRTEFDKPIVTIEFSERAYSDRTARGYPEGVVVLVKTYHTDYEIAAQYDEQIERVLKSTQGVLDAAMEVAYDLVDPDQAGPRTVYIRMRTVKVT